MYVCVLSSPGSFNVQSYLRTVALGKLSLLILTTPQGRYHDDAHFIGKKAEA